MRILSAFLLVALLTTTAIAAPPATINLHGQLLSSSGTPVSGSRAYTVQFHDAGTGGNTIGSALTGTVDVSADGLFNLEVTPPAGILTATEVWYSLGVDTDEPADSSAADDVFPSRIRVHSVPFALQANEVVAVDAVRIGGGAVDNTEFGALDGVTGNIQSQIDAIDATGIAADISQLETDVAAKANSTDVYTKSEVDTTVTGLQTDISAKANSSDVYTKTEVDTTVTGLQTDISAKANSTDVYTKSEVDTTVTGLQTNISAKANTTDVYAKTDADDKFLDVTGDTMAGALGVDTIGEATSAAGVTVDGVLLKDNFVELAAISAPGVTSNKLYNTGGNLFWNGTQLNGGGGGGGTSEVLRTFCVSGTLAELVVGTTHYGINEKHSDAVTRHVQFINDPAQRVVTDIQVYVNEYEAYTGARTVELTAVIRDIATGTIAHTVSTSTFDAVAATNFAWHTLPISAVLADRTIEPTEFLAITVSLVGADGGAGEMDLSFRATLE